VLPLIELRFWLTPLCL
jgi:hypothetical protein